MFGDPGRVDDGVVRRVPAGQALLITPLAQLATRQHGVVSRTQLIALGLSRQQIETLIAAGHLIRVHRGVYAVGHRRLSPRGRWMAAILACGEGARLSHRDASALHGLRRIGTGPIHVSARSARRVPGVRCHRAREPDRLGHAVIDGIPVTSLERTVLDEAATLSAAALRALLEAAQRRDRLDLRRFRLELEAGNGHRGCGRLRTALTELADLPPFLASSLEASFLTLAREGGLPEPSMNVIVAGERVDAHWPRYGLLVEVDSWLYHRDRRSFEEDRRRSNAFVLARQMVLHVTDVRINGAPAEVAREVGAALRLLGWGGASDTG